MFKCVGTLVTKKEHKKSIRKELGSLEDYDGRSTEKLTRSQHPSR